MRKPYELESSKEIKAKLHISAEGVGYTGVEGLGSKREHQDNLVVVIQEAAVLHRAGETKGEDGGFPEPSPMELVLRFLRRTAGQYCSCSGGA